MFKCGSIEDELMRSMERELVSNQTEEQHGFNKMAKAIDCLHAAADIFDQSGMLQEAQEVTGILQKLANDEWEDEIPGGLADKKTPDDFDAKALAKGVKVEMEHTNNKHMATEIAMDHLTEDPNYYEKLEKMEKQTSVYNRMLIVQAISADDIEGLLDKLNLLDISQEDLKNIFMMSPIGMMANVANRLYQLAKKTKDDGVSGLVDEIKNQLKEVDLTDPEKREEIKEDIASKLSTAIKTLKIVSLFA